ncbi:MAG: EAL domain-containing protein [Wenzhouxiangellaceae bacterium]
MGTQRKRTRLALYRHAPHSGKFVAGAIALAFVTLLGVLTVLDLLHASRAFVNAEGIWTRATLAAVHHLDRYAQTGNRNDLDQARASLRTAELSLEARDALLAGDPQPGRARRLLVEAGYQPDDVTVIVRWIPVFSLLPGFSEGMAQWLQTDVWIRRLSELGAELQSLLPDPARHRTEIGSIRDELSLIRGYLTRQAERFSAELGDGARRLSRGVFWVVVLGVLIVTAAVVGIYHWTLAGLRRSELRFWRTFEHAPVGIALLDPGGSILKANGALVRLLGRDPQALSGAHLGEFVETRDARAVQKILDAGPSPEAKRPIEVRFRSASGKRRWVRLSLAELGSASTPRDSTQIAAIEDITEIRSLAAELAYQSAHDQLTGLPNRREFERALNSLLRDRDPAASHALCLIDLDQFKLINNTFGHLAGDTLLVRVAETIQAELREHDLLARLDGDEFGIIMNRCNLETATRVATRVSEAIGRFQFRWENHPIRISASIAVSDIGPADNDPNELMQRLDLLCFEAKEQGRSQVRARASGDQSVNTHQHQMAWVQRVREAIDEDRLTLYGQWIAPSDVRLGWRCELLTRLVDRAGRVHAAGSFIGAAERFNTARLIDQWAVKETLARLPDLAQRFPEILAWHVNLSAHSIDCDRVLPELLEMIDRAGLRAGSLCFEITESAVIHSLDEAQTFFSALKQAGCEIALDDFGKGVATLDYLKHLPVDLVKIDGSFVRDLAHSELDHAMVRSVHEIARIAGMRTVAESVESIELIVRLQQIGVDLMQGHAIHNPTSLDTLELPPARDLMEFALPRARLAD